MKRFMDIVVSLAGLLILSPLLILLALMVRSTGPGGVLYRQVRIGKDEIPFCLFKFRTMRPGADRQGQLTISNRDPRITETGYFLRRYKLDELPQLWNILRGDMSLVGPRPEVPEYVSLYDDRQRLALRVRPGLTDYASLEYINESTLLARSQDPHRTYVETIMPAKLELNLKYIREQSLLGDLSILAKTVFFIFR